LEICTKELVAATVQGRELTACWTLAVTTYSQFTRLNEIS